MTVEEELKGQGENGSQFIYCPNISTLTIQQAKISNYIITTSAAACLTIILAQLSLLLLYRAYRTVLQRLYFHYVLITSFSLVSTALMIELQFDVTKEFCNWLGFVKEWWYLSINLYILGLAVTLTATTYSKMRSKPYSLCRSSKVAIIFEVIFTVAAFLLPLTYLWKMKKRHKFGVYGSVCWMEMYNEMCVPAGKAELHFSIAIVLLKLIVVVLYSILLIVLHLVIIKKYKQDRRGRLKILGRALFLLVICSISIIQSVVHHALSHPNVYGKLDHAVYDPIDALLENTLAVLLPVAFGLYIYSPSKLKWRELKRACQECPICSCNCCCKLKIASSKAKKGVGRTDGNSGTFEDSSDHDVPSYTTYSSPYTNEFTEITDIIGKEAYYGSMDVKIASHQKKYYMSS